MLNHERFLGVMGDIRAVLGKSPKLLAEFDRARFAREATHEDAASYLVMNPAPWAPEERAAHEFDHLTNHVGRDAWRMRAGDDLLYGNSVNVLPVGGSCAIETWGTRTIERVRQHETDRLSAVAERLLEMAPTFSHATGALLTGGRHGVHFIEDRLWASRLTQWGLTDAARKVRTAYDRIHAAVERRARLINPEVVLTAINFDELELRDGPIRRWFSEMGIEDDESFGIAEVLYTYCGPELRDIVSKLLRQGGHLWGQDVTHVVRLKQVDHNDWDSSMDRVAKGIVLNGGVLPEDATYAVRTGIAVARWVRRHRETNPSRVAGFFDMPYGSGPIHMVPNLPAANNTTDALIASPVRLWHGNLDEHLAYLQTMLEPVITRTEGEAFTAGVNLRARRGKVSGKLAKATSQRDRKVALLAELGHAQSVYEMLQRGERPSDSNEDQTIVDLMIHRIDRTLTSFEDRELTPRDAQESLMLRALREDLTGETMRPEIWHAMVVRFEEDRVASIKLANSALAQAEQEIEAATRELAQIDAQIQPAAREKPVFMTVYPLHTNLFILYATQFLFDPDFRDFLHEVATVEQSDLGKEDKQPEIRRLCAQIFPKLSVYLRYIMTGGEFPERMRSSRVFHS